MNSTRLRFAVFVVQTVLATTALTCAAIKAAPALPASDPMLVTPTGRGSTVTLKEVSR